MNMCVCVRRTQNSVSRPCDIQKRVAKVGKRFAADIARFRAKVVEGEGSVLAWHGVVRLTTNPASLFHLPLVSGFRLHAFAYFSLQPGLVAWYLVRDLASCFSFLFSFFFCITRLRGVLASACFIRASFDPCSSATWPRRLSNEATYYLVHRSCEHGDAWVPQCTCHRFSPRACASRPVKASLPGYY